MTSSWTCAPTSCGLRLVNFSGKVANAQGKAISGIAGVTFAIYKDQYEGAPLWLETQNVTADTKGNYTVQLGAARPEGLPLDLFSSGEARWLGVTVNGGAEQPRVLLLSVPYALKAADAETIGGLPPSAFVLANKNQGVDADTKTAAQAPMATAKNAVPPSVNPAVTGKGVANFIPVWDTTSDIIDSLIFQKTSQIGINTTAPAATLDVNGKGDVRDTLTLFPKGTDPTVAISGTTFKVDQTGKVTFISGQKFPGTGTITGVTTASGSGLSGGGTSGTLTLKVPAAGITNAMLQSSNITLNATAAGGLTVPGPMTLGATSAIGLKTCAATQILQYSGSVWNCSAVGTGTVISVGLSAPSSDFTVSGAPVTTSGTLGLSWNVAPTSSNTINAIVKRDGTGSFTAQTITVANLFATSNVFLTSGISNALNTVSTCASCVAIRGESNSLSGTGEGVVGVTDSSQLGTAGVYGVATASTGNAFGVQGSSFSSTGLGVVGNNGELGSLANSFIGTTAMGVLGDSNGTGMVATSDTGQALVAENNSSSDTLVSINNSTGLPLFVAGPGGSVRVDGNGNLFATGAINGASKNFRIDHPVDPTNKYLNHTSIESSEMLNLYTGNAVLDADGSATVSLPAWFTALNQDFRYQLTPIGAFAPLYIAEQLTNNHFLIAGGHPGMKVSWQISAVRHDAYANAHPLTIEEEKGAERGHYLHPELYGATREQSVGWDGRQKSPGESGAKGTPHSTQP
jgi:hypothetical protein